MLHFFTFTCVHWGLLSFMWQYFIWQRFYIHSYASTGVSVWFSGRNKIIITFLHSHVYTKGFFPVRYNTLFSSSSIYIHMLPPVCQCDSRDGIRYLLFFFYIHMCTLRASLLCVTILYSAALLYTCICFHRCVIKLFSGRNKILFTLFYIHMCTLRASVLYVTIIYLEALLYTLLCFHWWVSMCFSGSNVDGKIIITLFTL